MYNEQNPGYSEFGYNEHPFITSRFLCIKLLVVSGTECNLNTNDCTQIFTDRILSMDEGNVFTPVCHSVHGGGGGGGGGGGKGWYRGGCLPMGVGGSYTGMHYC